jgi:hypothetical protein
MKKAAPTWAELQKGCYGNSLGEVNASPNSWRPAFTPDYSEWVSGEIDDNRIGNVRAVHHPVPHRVRGTGFEVDDDDFR